MIPRLKGIVAHSYSTKLPREDGEYATTDWETIPSPKEKPFGEDSRDTWTMFGGIDLTPRRILLGSTSRVGVIIDLKKWERANPTSYPVRRSRPAKHQGGPP